MDDAKHLMRKKHAWDHFYIECIEYFKSKKEWKSSLYFSLLKVFRHTFWKNCWGTPQQDWIFAKLPPQSCCVSTVSWSGWKFKSGIGFCGGRKTSEARANSRVKDENSRSRVENKNTLLPKYNTKFRPLGLSHSTPLVWADGASA